MSERCRDAGWRDDNGLIKCATCGHVLPVRDLDDAHEAQRQHELGHDVEADGRTTLRERMKDPKWTVRQDPDGYWRAWAPGEWKPYPTIRIAHSAETHAEAIAIACHELRMGR